MPILPSSLTSGGRWRCNCKMTHAGCFYSPETNRVLAQLSRSGSFWGLTRGVLPNFQPLGPQYRYLTGLCQLLGVPEEMGVCGVDPDEAITLHVPGHSGGRCHPEPDAARRAWRSGRVAGVRGVLPGQGFGVPQSSAHCGSWGWWWRGPVEAQAQRVEGRVKPAPSLWGQRSRVSPSR
ncbi:uncharacterized protein LOC125086411 isoform X2 [Lutra lutra]|uniref:uncharacterized protein LOC125086411 isoform X2 n=1 Tax=Lutra lutra TaxID=9657 RepID=UPI001FD28F76|nr:uncharacterized protein LOC125086411 isoform X2 [Lutra lutra]